MYYAAYGSNLHPLRLTERISSARLITTGFLPNWSLHFHKRSEDGSGKCNILSGGDGVHVGIFDISAKDKITLDGIEGVGFGYSEIALCIPEFGDCVSYVADESYIDNSLVPYDWYKELVLIGARTHDFPDDYMQRIELIRTRCDPDPIRRVRNWNTVELVKTGTEKYATRQHPCTL